MGKVELYRPANGTEGMWFEENWCDRCQKEIVGAQEIPGPNECNIYELSLLHDTDEPEYPKEMCYDKDGHSCCTAFVEKQEE